MCVHRFSRKHAPHGRGVAAVCASHAVLEMLQVEAVVKMLQPGFNVAGIAAKRRNKSNPWFKRGNLFKSAVDVLRRAAVPMTAREIA